MQLFVGVEMIGYIKFIFHLIPMCKPNHLLTVVTVIPEQNNITNYYMDRVNYVIKETKTN